MPLLLLPLRLAWRVFSRVAGALMLPVSGAVWCLRLLRHGADIRAAEVVVLMTRFSGFGNSIQGPDAARRMYRGKRCVFIAPYWNFKNNPEFNPFVTRLWSDIKVILLPRFAWAVQYKHRAISIPFVRGHDRMIVKLTKGMARLLAGKDVIFKDMVEVYKEALPRGTENTEADGFSLPRVSSAESRSAWKDYELEVGYMFILMRTGKMIPIRLPDAMREDMENRTQEAWRNAGGAGTAKLCCLYLRFEHRESYTTRLRNSSTVEDHLAAIRLLNEAGYQVLLTGDREMDPAIRREFSGRFIDSDSISVDKNLFQLFAATEADIFIGNNGGGITPALANGTPGLYLDWYPIYMGYPNSWFYFKTISTSEGKMVAPEELITKHAYDLFCSFGVLKNITSEEIRDAVACFIEDVEDPQSSDPYAHVAALFPEDTPFRLSGARLSPAWVRRYFQDSPEQAGSQSVTEQGLVSSRVDG
jgi:putative glycosyltransferase (TIGR04372 family)|tara:strand:+ start:604 stop:2022 length:1419 start_codon:yes stop_codon:yes gene_type:complete